MKKIFTTTGKALAFFLGWAILTGLMPFPDSSNGAIWRFWAELIPLLSAAGFNLLFWLPERQALSLRLCTAPLKSAMIGFAAGVLWLGIAAGVLLLTGTMHITRLSTGSPAGAVDSFCIAQHHHAGAVNPGVSLSAD